MRGIKRLEAAVVLRIVPLVMVLCGTVGCSGDPLSVDGVRPVIVAEVASATEREATSFSGIIRERNLVRLSFRVAGQVASLPLEEGQFVRRGELLSRLDSRDYELHLEAVRAEHSQVAADVKRYKELYARKNITESEYEKALAGEKRMNAKLRAAENVLGDTRLTAPFDGYVQALYVGEAEMVDAGTLVVSLVDLSFLIIETNIPPAFYLLRGRFETYSFSTPLYPGTEVPLELIGIAAKADMGNLYRARFRYHPDSGCLLAPGMSVRVTISYRRDAPPGLRVPLTAVVAKEGERFVWIYRDSRVVKQPVKTGMTGPDGMVGIEAGLSPGDMIVTAGVHSLVEGQAVRRVE